MERMDSDPVSICSIYVASLLFKDGANDVNATLLVYSQPLLVAERTVQAIQPINLPPPPRVEIVARRTLPIIQKPP